MPRVRRNRGKTITQIDNQFWRLRNNIRTARNNAPRGSERRAQLNERGRRLDATYVRYSQNIGRQLTRDNIGYTYYKTFNNGGVGNAGIIINQDDNSKNPSRGRELTTVRGRRDSAQSAGLSGYWEFPRSTYMGTSRGSINS